MADTKISALTAAGALTGTEIVPLVQTTTKRTTLATIATYINSLVSVAFSSLTGKPTTLSGYGITDAQPLSANLTAYAGASWGAGVQIATLTAAGTVALKAVGSASGNLLDKAAGDALYQPLAAYAPPAVSSQSGTSYTAVLGDANTFVRFTSASTVTFTIPPNSSVAFAVGTEIHFSQSGAGALSVAAGAGVTINSRASDLTLAGQYAVAFVKQVAADTWIMNGDL